MDKRVWLCFIVMLAASAACVAGAPVLAHGQAELVSNGSFETLADGKPVGWTTHTWAGRAGYGLGAPGHEGERCATIESDQGVDGAWSAFVQVKPFSKYRLTGWIKTENVVALDGQGAMLNIHARQEHTRAIAGTQDWTQVETEIETGMDDGLQINCLLGFFGRAKGKASFDDIRLELLETRKLEPTVNIDLSKSASPISKYIYSQFIEHLGRCIYGGIWAEMLEDRKFYNPVGKAGSPWKPIGGAGVTMQKGDAFVGEHTPRITLPGKGEAGIAQAGLALVAGKAYVGRIWLAGERSVGPIRVRLAWGDGPEESRTITIKTLSSKFTKTPLEFKAPKSTANARLEIVSSGSGAFRVGTVSLMPADNVHGMRSDTLKLLKELDAPLYRWPGGNFASGYDWRDGIGDPDRRPPRKNPAWRGVEHNDFGIHEFMEFCRQVNTEPEVVVNSGFGDAHSAAEEVEYLNGTSDTPMGALRAKNGGPVEPYKVGWWAIGNEMFGSWQLGYMALNQYELKHNDFARQMRKVDPGIKLIGVGDAGPWSQGMLTNCADSMDLLSEHFYCQERPSVMAHVGQVPSAIRAKVAAHRKYRETLPSLKGKDIRISMDEWNYWYGPEVYGELGTRYFMKDALGIAAGLHEYFRNSDIVYMANYAQTVNVIGAIKTTKTDAAFETTGLVLKLYRAHFGSIPIPVTGAPQPLDVSAAWTEDRKTLTLAVVNPTGEEAALKLNLSGKKLGSMAKTYTIASTDPQAYNEPGKPAKVWIQAGTASLSPLLKVSPYSITLYEIRP